MILGLKSASQDNSIQTYRQEDLKNPKRSSKNVQTHVKNTCKILHLQSMMMMITHHNTNCCFKGSYHQTGLLLATKKAAMDGVVVSK